MAVSVATNIATLDADDNMLPRNMPQLAKALHSLLALATTHGINTTCQLLFTWPCVPAINKMSQICNHVPPLLNSDKPHNAFLAKHPQAIIL
eukprot:3178959-Ditylum_brightwellii.AAC.1